MPEASKYVLLWVGYLLFAMADWLGVINPDRTWYGVIVAGILIYFNNREIELLRLEVNRLKSKIQEVSK